MFLGGIRVKKGEERKVGRGGFKISKLEKYPCRFMLGKRWVAVCFGKRGIDREQGCRELDSGGGGKKYRTGLKNK